MDPNRILKLEFVWFARKNNQIKFDNCWLLQWAIIRCFAKKRKIAYLVSETSDFEYLDNLQILQIWPRSSDLEKIWSWSEDSTVFKVQFFWKQACNFKNFSAKHLIMVQFYRQWSNLTLWFFLWEPDKYPILRRLYRHCGVRNLSSTSKPTAFYRLWLARQQAKTILGHAAD
jgi:hypothetical protein